MWMRYGRAFSLLPSMVSIEGAGMEIVETLQDLRRILEGFRARAERIALVPTMGNLHAGHYSLIELGKRHADRTVATSFVNPTQFGPNEDFARYPRTPGDDERGLADAGCDVLFRPTVETMYPFGAQQCVKVQVPGLMEELEGAQRPGHFDGVATVVLRLFNMARPDLAVFGRKDYQQLRVIEYLVRELSLPIDIVPAPIARDHDGLALSSRNQYLDAAQRAIAPELRRTLLAMQEGWRAGVALPEIERTAQERLTAAGFAMDYAQFRRRSDLRRPEAGDRDGLVILATARLGRTRLLDNLELDAFA